MRNLGAEAVEEVRQTMRVDEEWLVRFDEGYRWWLGWLAQDVWWEGPFEYSDDLTLWSLHAHTDLVTGLTPSEETLSVLAEMSDLMSVSGIVRHPEDEGRIQLGLSMIISAENFDRVLHQFKMAVALQAEEAHRLSSILEENGTGRLAASAHPESGGRENPDDMLNVIEDVFGPSGAEPSRWAGSLAGASESLENMGGWVQSNESSVTATFGPDAMMRIFAEGDHQLLGNGVWVLTNIGHIGFENPSEATDVALQLNELNANSQLLVAFTGTWTRDADNGLQHQLFLPNAMFYPGVLENELLNIMGKVRITFERLLPQTEWMAGHEERPWTEMGGALLRLREGEAVVEGEES